MKFLIALFSIMLAISSAAKAETITIVADMWCPYNCAPDSFKPGFMVEIAQKAFAKHNITIEYKILPWSRALEETRAGKYDALAGAAKSDAPDFIFSSIPQAMMRNAFYVKSDSEWYFNDMATLATISLGVVDDYTYSEALDSYINTNKKNMKKVQIVSGDDAFDANIKKLLAGRIGALIEAEYVMRYEMAERKLDEKIKEAGILPDEGNEDLYIAFSPANPESKRYAAILAKESDIMRSSGELKKIMSNYGIKDAGR